MRTLSGLYTQYYKLQEERFYIQEDKKYWPEFQIADYAGMVGRVNQLSPEIRKIAKEISRIESKIS